MLEQIYASTPPVRFEQLDVSAIVARYFPTGTPKATVLEAFNASATSKVVQDTADRIVVRDNKGQAMLDPDARSVVITFTLDPAGKVSGVHALHMKNQ